MREYDKLLGCLLAGAAGDALGYPVEFLRDTTIKKRYGPGGIREFDLTRGAARISDDTQMTLFTASGLLSAFAGDGNWVKGIWEAYLDWYATQSDDCPDYEAGEGRSWLLNVPGIWASRAPGTTCMGSLCGGRPGSIKKPRNNSFGCGGVMRVAPVGLFFGETGPAAMNIDEMDRLSADAAALTHGGDRAWLPAALLAHIVRRVSEDGMPVPEAAREGLAVLERIFPAAPSLGKFRLLILSALELAGSAEDDLDAVTSLGEGWVGDEALAIALFCAARYSDDIEAALTASVNHSGDSDSTGSITGNILGASLGAGAIPEKFLTALELRGVISKIATDLAAPGESEGFRERYILGTYRI